MLPTALLAANRPRGGWHAIAAPGNPTFSVVVVEHWADHAAEDTWEDLAGITQLYPEMMGATAPPSVITAFAPWGAITGMTLREVFRLVRRQWSVFRP